MIVHYGISGNTSRCVWAFGLDLGLDPLPFPSLHFPSLVFRIQIGNDLGLD